VGEMTLKGHSKISRTYLLLVVLKLFSTPHEVNWYYVQSTLEVFEPPPGAR